MHIIVIATVQLVPIQVPSHLELFYEFLILLQLFLHPILRLHHFLIYVLSHPKQISNLDLFN